MFCTNCGNQVDENAVFCTNCGFKLYKEEVTQIPEAEPVIRPESQVSTFNNENQSVANVTQQPVKSPDEEVVPVNIMVQPVPDTTAEREIPKQTAAINGGNGASFVPYNNPQYVQMQQPVSAIKEKKNIIAFSILSVLFALLTIAASVFEMLDDVSEIQDVVRLIELSITSIILIVYAFTNDRTVSVLKGIAVAIAMVADAVFIGASSIKYSIESITNDNTITLLSKGSGKDEWVIMAFFISMLVWFGAMYIFFIIDAIRGFTGTRRIKTFVLFFGFIAVIGVIANIIFRAIIEDGIVLYSDIVPMNIIYVFFILTMCFGIIGKKNLKKQQY